VTELDNRVEEVAAIDVHLHGILVQHFHETSQYHDELMRELRLVQLSPSDDARLNELATKLLNEFVDFAPTLREAVAVAEDRGDTTVNLSIRIAPGLRPWLVEFRDHFREIDAFCEIGLLLALGSPGVAVVFREWLLGQLIGQIDGQAPQPYR
jgi:hypothetical protein